ncbi:MAG: hypothetical protein ABWY78_22700 [Microvirga sp.]
MGNASARWITGWGGNNGMQGAGGTDSPYGSQGDMLYGDTGWDMLTGGSWRNGFEFDANPAGGFDRIQRGRGVSAGLDRA